MIEFKKNTQDLFPYDREHYIDYLDDDFNSFTEWNGVSFQLKTGERELGLAKFFEFYAPVFKSIILNFDNDDKWIVNHDDKDLRWFPNNENNLNSLRTLFKQHSIPNAFVGALTFKKLDLLKYYKDIISYPFAVFYEAGSLYKNLDISNSKVPFIVKISGHWNIDLLSTDKELLRKIVTENTSSAFNVKEYRGTSL